MRNTDDNNYSVSFQYTFVLRVTALSIDTSYIIPFYIIFS